MKKQLSQIALTSIAVIALGCSGDTGIPITALDGDPTQATLAVEYFSSSMTLGKSNGDGTFSPNNFAGTIDSGVVSIERIDIDSIEGVSCTDLGLNQGSGSSAEAGTVTCEGDNDLNDDDGEAEIRIHGPILFDLITGESTPALAAIDLPSMTARRLRIKFDDNDLLNDNSLTTGGTFVDNSATTRNYEIRLDFNEEAEFRDDNGFPLAEDRLNCLVIGLDVESWFAGVDLAQCVANGDPEFDGQTLIIDDHTQSGDVCDNIENTVRDNIENSLRLLAGECGGGNGGGGDDSDDGFDHDVDDDDGDDTMGEI